MNGLIEKVEHPTDGALQMPSLPIGLSERPSRIPGTAPELGQHAERVLEEPSFRVSHDTDAQRPAPRQRSVYPLG